jgi:nucleolar protein 16
MQIERDPETGAILRVLDEQESNPLNDPLNELDDEMDVNYREVLASNAGRLASKKGGAVETEVTRQLDEYAASGERRAPRNQSELEQEWVAKLVGKHGDDYRAMFWDKLLNPMQQSEGDLKRRIKKWQAKQR